MRPVSYVMALLIAVAMTGCASGGGSHAHDEGHAHEENLQLTAYNDRMEVFAEVTPLVVGQQSDVLAHFTHLDNFKPLEKGKVTVCLIVGTEGIRQSAEAPSRPGIYRFALVPTVKGGGKMLFDIETEEGKSQLVVRNVYVYDNEHDAQHSAADVVASSSNGAGFTKEMSWKVDFATEPCRLERFGKVIRTMARIEPSQDGEQVITAKSSGIVTFTNQGILEGKAVSNGQALFYLSGGDMVDNNLSVRYREAESNYNLAKREYDRKSELVKDQIVSESELLQAKRDYETAEAVYNNMRRTFSADRQTVSAPIGGFVNRLLVRNGEYVEAGQPLAVISKNNTLYVKAEVQSRNYPTLKGAVSANFRLPNADKTYSLEELDGRLVSYGKAVSVENPLLPVVYQIKNEADFLPGSFIELYIKTEGTEEVITVPNASLVEEMGNYFVYVQLTPEFFEKREVKIGATDGERTAILAGLHPSERVVSKGAVLVKLAQSTGALDAHAGHVH